MINAKAIISLTSWSARIKTVGLTIFNLLSTCPGFHVVLCLSTEEFPGKESDLPHDLVSMSNAGLLELLWVHKNYKSFKKVLPAMAKYHDLPIISADDDCLYRYNYADELYQLWKRNPSFFVTYYTTQMLGKHITGGYATLFPPHVFENYTNILAREDIINDIIACHEDDCLYACLREKVNATRIMSLNKDFSEVAVSHDEYVPLHDLYRGDAGRRHLETMWKIIQPL